ncbi:MAG: nuclear transport factor 2 family protein [Anaerolineaceae bacterium]
MADSTAEVRQVLQRFQEGYLARDVAQLDAFMALFAAGDGIELIGIGASVRNQNEWFEGRARIREIVESDWRYWGDVRLAVEDAKITVWGEAAWLSTIGAILQTDDIQSDEVTGFTLNQMKEMLADERLSPRQRLVEAAHFGVRRWREREKPAGYSWTFVFTAVLVRQEGQWRFHTIHWSMPVA